MHDIIHDLARAWAAMDGRLDAFIAERDGVVIMRDAAFTGHYDGYMTEAAQLLESLKKDGWTFIRS